MGSSCLLFSRGGVEAAKAEPSARRPKPEAAGPSIDDFAQKLRLSALSINRSPAVMDMKREQAYPQ
jgi:hypothetical protein